MSSRSTRKATASVLDSVDGQLDDSIDVASSFVEQQAQSEPDATAIVADALSDADACTDASPPNAIVADSSDISGVESTVLADAEPAPDALARQLEQLVQSVGVVEDLSRRAREAAASDLAHYDALLVSRQQYASRLEEASTIRDQARNALGRAFGQEARSAAEQLVDETEQVVQVFGTLANTWQQRASSFIEQHPDIQQLLDERRVHEERARQQEMIAARARQLEVLVAGCENAIGHGLLHDGQRLVEGLEREFPEQRTTIQQLRLALQQKFRAEKDDAARNALALCAEHQARGDHEGAVGALEQVDVQGLSIDVSQDVFGRWSDACSCLAQTAAATLLRFAPAQGRGLILYADPTYPNGLIVFSSLGMGPGFPQGIVVTDIAVLRRARPFREAAPLPVTSWTSSEDSVSHGAAVAPTRH
jgi:hypothetical protein